MGRHIHCCDAYSTSLAAERSDQLVDAGTYWRSYLNGYPAQLERLLAGDDHEKDEATERESSLFAGSRPIA